MSTYIVALFSQHSGELTMHRVVGVSPMSPLDACNTVLDYEYKSLGEMYDAVSNQDTWINWVQL